MLGVAFGITGIVLVMASRGQSSEEAALEVLKTTPVEPLNALPEGIGLILIALVFVSAGGWLFLTLSDSLNATTIRMLILTVGGMTGLIIAFMTIFRALAWWDDIFAKGIAVWQGERAWRMWACFYAELFGLALAFGSLLLGQADVRSNPSVRRMLYGYNAALTGLLVLLILVVLNVTVYARVPFNFEWTKTRGFYSLSDLTRNTLENLKDPVTIYVLLTPETTDWRDMRNLLQNMEQVSDKLDVRYVAPDRDRDQMRELVRKFPKILEGSPFDQDRGRGLIMILGTAADDNPRYSFIPANKLATVSPPNPHRQEPPRRDFKGEDVFLTELRFAGPWRAGHRQHDAGRHSRRRPDGARLARARLRGPRARVGRACPAQARRGNDYLHQGDAGQPAQGAGERAGTDHRLAQSRVRARRPRCSGQIHGQGQAHGHVQLTPPGAQRCLCRNWTRGVLERIWRGPGPRVHYSGYRPPEKQATGPLRQPVAGSGELDQSDCPRVQA
jgi:hypothetical protein